MKDGCLDGGFNVVRRDPINELMIMNDFSSNINLIINGETLSQNQLIEKLYYGQDEFNKILSLCNSNEIKRLMQRMLHKH